MAEGRHLSLAGASLTLVMAFGLTTAGAAFSADPVLYRATLGCGDCFWQLVLAGHPTDPELLAAIGVAGGLRLSRDGGHTWSPGTLAGQVFAGDPKLVVTAAGTLLLSGLISRPHPLGGTVYAGGVFQGPLDGSSFSGVVFKDPPAMLPADQRHVVDFPKLAVDANAGTIYVSSNATRFDDGTVGMGLFVSRDGGVTFAGQKLLYQPADTTYVSPPITMDTMPDGTLRAVFVAGSGTEDRQYLLRFDAAAASFTVVPGLSLPGLSVGVARIAAAGTRDWLVYQGPELAIDRTPGGPHEGRLYLAWAQPAAVVQDPGVELGRYGLDFDVWLAHSDDDGETWSVPVRVNDDATAADQIFPSMRLDAEGLVHLAFLDRRAAPDLPQFDVSYALVDDDRVSPNVRVNEASVANALGGRALGDYLDMVVAYPSRAYVAYPCGASGDGPSEACLTALDPTALRTSSTTLPPPTTSSTTTTSTTVTTTLTVPPASIPSCLPVAALSCDDGDACTDDAGDRTSGCFHTERAPTTPPGVLCAVANLHAMIGLPPEPVCQADCARSLETRLDGLARKIAAGLVAPGPRACQRRLHGAVRRVSRLEQRLGRLAHRVSRERAACLRGEAARLHDRAAILAAAFCVVGPPRRIHAEPRRR